MFALSFCLVTLDEDLSIVVSPVATVAVSSVSVVESRVSIGMIGTISIEEGISLSLRLGISRSLSVVAVGMRIAVAVCSVSSIGIGIGTVSIGQPGISLSVSLGLWLGSGESGKANHKSELHCNLRVEFRIPM